MNVQYFGCWERPGHALHSSDGRTAYGATNPWGDGRRCVFDGKLPPTIPDPSSYNGKRECPQGHAAIHHKDGWTALAFWDRSVDNRGGCNSVFFIEGEHGFAEAVEIAESAFPRTWARLPFSVVPASPECGDPDCDQCDARHR